MSFDPAGAVVAGMLAGVVMALPVVVAAMSGTPAQVDMLRLWGTWRRGPLPPAAAGVLVHLALSALVGLLYALGFAAMGADERLWLWGLGGGVVHWLVGGTLLAPIAAAHPDARSMPTPGVLCARLGATDVLVFLAAHLAYGLAFGLLYG